MSPFAASLQKLFDETGLFTREEWCVFLSIQTTYPPSAAKKDIDKWLCDEGIPRPDQLGMIVLALKYSSGVIQAPIDEFEKMANRRSTEVAPGINGKLMLPTVKEYISRSSICELSSKLAKLDDRGKADLLVETYPA